MLRSIDSLKLKQEVKMVALNVIVRLCVNLVSETTRGRKANKEADKAVVTLAVGSSGD